MMGRKDQEREGPGRLIGFLTLLFALGVGGCVDRAGPNPDAVDDGSGITPASSGGINAASAVAAPYVVMISFDGFRHDYLARYETPNLDRLAATGVAAEALIPVYPTLTFPSHYSIATGMYPEHHGLVANSFYDSELDDWYNYRDPVTVQDGRWYGGEPIWVTAESQGMVTAAYFWVGTEAPISGVQPTTWKQFDASVSRNQRVDSALVWLARPEQSRPHLVTLYFEDVNGAGHAVGPGTPEVERAVSSVDRALGRLLDGLERLPHGDQVNIVVVSDHGMSEVAPERRYFLEDVIDSREVVASGLGAHGNLFVREGGLARARELAEALERGMPNVRVFLKEDVPASLHFSEGPRVGDIILLPADGWHVSDSRNREQPVRGDHGYDPSFPNMWGIFVAGGPNVRRSGVIPSFESVHIYPMVAEILGLRAASGIDGDAKVLGPLVQGAPAR